MPFSQASDFGYWLTGLLIISNLGTICSIVWFGARAVWWASKVDTRITHNEESLDELREDMRSLSPRRL